MKYPDWKLERFLLQELPEKEYLEIQKKCQHDQVLQARIDALRLDSLSFLQEYPMLEKEMDSRVKKQIVFPVWGHSLVASIVMLFILGYWMNHNLETEIKSDFDTRLKGSGVHWQIFQKSDLGSSLLSNGDSLQEGDLLQIQYQIDSPQYAYVVSKDGNGIISIHLDASDSLLDKGSFLAKHSYELDNAPKYETFYFFSSREPLLRSEITPFVKKHNGKSSSESLSTSISLLIQSHPKKDIL